MSIATLGSPDVSAEEHTQIITDLLALKKTQIREFLARNGLSTSGTKEQIRCRIEDALNEGSLPFLSIVLFLDEVIPWGKQHVFLYRGPTASISDWRNVDWLTNRLHQCGADHCLNTPLPLVLPQQMTVSSIVYSSHLLRVTAIKKREWFERNPEYDGATTTSEGDDVELRAFTRRVTRSLVAFEWNLAANIAFLQISQIRSRFRYKDVAKEFFDLVSGWLDISRFAVVDLRPVIKRLHDLEESGTGEACSHRFRYRTLEGRMFEGTSASPEDPLLGDVVMDTALNALKANGIGHLGDFYWLPRSSTDVASNPLDSKVHVKIIGAESRINFMTPNTEQTVRYVLSRIRHHSSGVPGPAADH
jgi:hypothetical protein